MDSSRIAELLAPFLGTGSLSAGQIEAVQTHLDLLLKWNAKINLTAIRNPDEIVTRHFGESFFAAEHLGAIPAETAIDIGSGAGFPGLPLKLWIPDLKLTLIESNQRKATFLREVLRALELSNVEVRSERAEALSVKADFVTLRAVENFDRILPIAFGLIKPNGRIGMLIGEAQIKAAHTLLANLQWKAPVPIPNSRQRVLLVGQA
jgi:16S rRNA (guanine527-N7)-methyltransferase